MIQNLYSNIELSVLILKFTVLFVWSLQCENVIFACAERRNSSASVLDYNSGLVQRSVHAVLHHLLLSI